MQAQKITQGNAPLTVAYQKPLIANNSKDFHDIFRSIWDLSTIHRHERMYVLYLNYKKEVIRHELISIGNHSECVIDIRAVVEYALTSGADYLVIAHNHIHSNPNPSKADLKLTERTSLLFNLLDIQLFDHVILTDDNYFSFRDNKLLN